MRYVAGTYFQTPFPTKILAARKKLNPYYYRLNDGLSHGIGIGRLAPLLFEKNVPKSGAYEAIAPTSRRYFRRKFWPHEKTEPLLLLFKAWAFIWYRYCPASIVPLPEKCTESLCDMSLARTFRRHFRRIFWPHEKTEPLLLPSERGALTWYRYWPASTVPLREKCTEKWCP